MENTTRARSLTRAQVIVVLLLVLGLVLFSILPLSFWPWFWGRLSVFATVFLGIFIEAVPFLLMGTITSGLVEVFLPREQMNRLVPQGALPAALVGAVLGLAFPVCECGVIPLTRRLFRKGLPLPAGVAFLLAAPVINPIVILSTAAAFGWGQMLLWRVVITLLIAITVGLIFSFEKETSTILLPFAAAIDEHLEQVGGRESFRVKLEHALVIGADEFFDMGRYLVFGAILASCMQTFIPQSALLGVGSGPLLSVLVMLAMAALLSICSTVDAFVALGFMGTFSFGAVLSFLTFGPMVDIKSILMYLQVFRRRPVFYLVLLPFLMSLLAGVIFNYLAV